MTGAPPIVCGSVEAGEAEGAAEQGGPIVCGSVPLEEGELEDILRWPNRVRECQWAGIG